MQIGSMRERILIQKRTVRTDAIGNRSSIWEDYAKRWAYANHISGREYWEAAQVQAEDNIYFLIRCDSSTKRMDTVNYRIVFRGETYNIRAIDNILYRDKTLKITVESGES